MQGVSRSVSSASQAPNRSSSWRDYAQLVRLPAVFTALADIGLGWCGALATGTSWDRWPGLLLLLGASACLYSGGMVWNDFFDIEQDRRERPLRPLPSGRIDRRRAGVIGGALLTGGVGLALLAGLVQEPASWTPAYWAGLLVLTILLYDACLKRTWAGPLGMGACRFLNILLGLSLATASFSWSARVFVALVIGLYIVGVTWFARTEARRSSQTALKCAAGLMLSALVLALAVPIWVERTHTSALFPYLLVIQGFLVGIPVFQAIAEPTPPRVQAGVKRALLGLVILDATLASALVGTAGLLLLILLVPVLYLGRWIYVT